MRSLIPLFSLLPLVLSQGDTSLHTTIPTIDPKLPIYLGDVFWPPSMTFIAWLPSENNYLTEWCSRAIDASNHKLFSLGGVDSLQIHDYFGEQAYITREGKRYANCRVTPESGRIGACQGILDYDCDGGHKYTGPGTRRWSCWVIREEARANRTWDEVVKEEIMNERLTDAMFTATGSATGATIASSVMGAFTAGHTGS